MINKKILTIAISAILFGSSIDDAFASTDVICCDAAYLPKSQSLLYREQSDCVIFCGSYNGLSFDDSSLEILLQYSSPNDRQNLDYSENHQNSQNLTVCGIPLELEIEKENCFFYLGLRATSLLNCEKNLLGDINLGWRTLDGPHICDLNFGLSTVYERKNFAWIAYVQSNYLYYPKFAQSFYVGVGLEGFLLFQGETLMIIPELPLTTGYQFQTKRPLFLQLQVFPLTSTVFSFLSLVNGGSYPIVCSSVSCGFGF